DYAFHLPGELIAQHPLDRRDDSRLLCLDRRDGAICHRRFRELPQLLRSGDVLVMNDSRVLPSRLLGHREGTGGAAELLLLEQKGKDLWETLARPGKKLRPGSRVVFGEGLLTGEIVDTLEGGNRLVRFRYEGDSFFAVLDRIGQMPLPPYITEALEDRERYQTVYSRELGSAAAPTAGLHFTPELLEALRNKGIQTGFVTLHVGLGTFRPVKAENITDHHMHLEHYTVPEETARLVNAAKAEGRRVIAVGTTSCRTLESAWKEGALTPGPGSTGIFIYPGYRFQVLDGLITNFHLPESTLIMLVSAFAGYESTMNAYREAVQERYRFFSFGDAMFIGDHGAIAP
ncbi:MAG: tRNA preQ1(34) S-adenosylmethionine ribosyltransferase-isomerase QueA, partial [Angelakisella sp.]|nr:tRNA preQ1(34) S-adenosylmethionine ribosyltransferase-isomerase QueA [Angelakisella sp.]